MLSLEPPGWGGVLLDGFLVSIEIAIGGFGLGVLIGALGASGKLYGGLVTRDLLEVYTTLVRAIPELILILLLYYAGTDLVNQALAAFGRDPIDINGLVAGIVVIGFVQALFHEVIRGAIKSIRRRRSRRRAPMAWGRSRSSAASSCRPCCLMRCPGSAISG